MKKAAALLLILFIGNACTAQDTSFFSSASTLNKNRFKAVIASEVILYSVSNIGLYHLWYKNYPQSSFHFFDDGNEWLQVDKIGHFTASYYIGKIGVDLLKWTGLENNKSVIWGGLTGFTFEFSIEMMDAFSAQWGFSGADMLANTAGTGLLVAQGLVWKEQRIQPKFSFHQTKYSTYNPSLLGSNFQENVLKDYNGHTYWLSGNVYSFLKRESRFPKWLNIALGYGADGMTGGFYNYTSVNGKTIPLFDRERHYYFSLDMDLSRIKTRSGLLKTIFKTIGFIKIPAPALKFTKGKGFNFYPLYF